MLQRLTQVDTGKQIGDGPDEPHVKQLWIREVTQPTRLHERPECQFNRTPGRLGGADRHGHLSRCGLTIHRRLPGILMIADFHSQRSVLASNSGGLNVAISFGDQLQNGPHSLDVPLTHDERAVGRDRLAKLCAAPHSDIAIVGNDSHIHGDQDHAHYRTGEPERNACSGG